MIRITFLLLVLASVSCIFIPLTKSNKRCMVIYSVAQSQTIKLDVKFPPMPNQQHNEFYEVSWKNTESDEVTWEKISSGKFKKELSLAINVIYDVCLTALTERDFGMVQVQYTSSSVFSLNQAQVKVPDSLLKTKDITNTFLNAEQIQKLAQQFTTMQKDRSSLHKSSFDKTNKISQSMIQISFFELVIIIIAGAYQFFSIRRYLQDKNYL